MIPSNDQEWLALLIWSEARGEPTDGQAAVARVVLNRSVLRYSSDGTVKGTILAPSQFSDFWFKFVGGHYVRVCHSLADAEVRAGVLMGQAKAQGSLWTALSGVAAAVIAETYTSPAYDVLTNDVVLYANLSISNPAWATADKFATKIGAHSFYHA